MSKACSCCGETKLLEEFYRHGTNKDGRQRWCKVCTVASNRQTQRGRIRVRRRDDPDFRQRQIDGKQWTYQTRESQRLRRLAERDEAKVVGTKPWARRVLAKAVQHGKIEKPSACESCGATPERHQLHGHHEDYSLPLDVEWLCSLCHGERHWVAIDQPPTHRPPEGVAAT